MHVRKPSHVHLRLYSWLCPLVNWQCINQPNTAAIPARLPHTKQQSTKLQSGTSWASTRNFMLSLQATTRGAALQPNLSGTFLTHAHNCQPGKGTGLLVKIRLKVTQLL